MNLDHVIFQLVLPLGLELAERAGKVKVIRMYPGVSGQLGFLHEGFGAGFTLEVLLSLVGSHVCLHQVGLRSLVVAPATFQCRLQSIVD